MEYKRYVESESKYTNDYASNLLYQFWCIAIGTLLVIAIVSILFENNPFSMNTDISMKTSNVLSLRNLFYVFIVGLLVLAIIFYYFSYTILGYFGVYNAKYIGNVLFYWFLFLAAVLLFTPI